MAASRSSTAYPTWSMRCNSTVPPMVGVLQQVRTLPRGAQHVVVQERPDRLIPDPGVLGLQDPVVLIGEVEVLRLFVVAHQISPQHEALAEGDAVVLLAVDD